MDMGMGSCGMAGMLTMIENINNRKLDGKASRLGDGLL